MTQALQHFVDLSIPGISGRDLARNAIPSVAAVGRVRKDLRHLDRHLLRDIGLDRDAA